MDPPPDPPLLAAQPPAVSLASPTAAAAANPIPTRALTHKHPPYAEMIRAAISTLNERNGSSKRAVTKYIETHYSNLPPTHLALLAHHLKRLKISGQILMVKNSYKLPKSAPLAVNGADPVSARPKGRPGRPPKPKPDAIQAPVPVFAPQPLSPPQNGDIGQVPVNVPVGPVNGSGRGRGRPPGRSGLKPKNGQLPTSGGGGGGRRGRERPKAVVAVRKMSTVGRPRGRPPKPINVVAAPSSSAAANVGGGVAAIITGKRRGRPPRADGEAKKPRKISAKPLGRPRKNEAAAATRTPDSSQLLVAYLDLKSKLEYLQLKVKQTVTSIVPSLVNEAAINALQELEHVALNVNARSTTDCSKPAAASAPELKSR